MTRTGDLPDALFSTTPCLDLMNSRFRDGDEVIDLLSPTALDLTAAWVERQADHHGLAAVAPSDVASTARTLGRLRSAALRLVSTLDRNEAPDRSAVDAVNDAARGASPARLLATSSDGLTTRPGDAGPRPFAAAYALSVVDLVAAGRLSSITPCPAPGCVLHLLADGRRRWCSNTCGNRVRVSRHHHRART